VSPAKRGDRVAPPAGNDQWEVRFATSEAAKGWEDLCQQAATKTAWAYDLMRNDPDPAVQTPRHHRLKGSRASGTYDRRALPQWQIEVTSAARIWYLVDDDHHTVRVIHAATKHPKATGG
jgi:hypothetical protein